MVTVDDVVPLRPFSAVVVSSGGSVWLRASLGGGACRRGVTCGGGCEGGVEGEGSVRTCSAGCCCWGRRRGLV